jgi:hypothetical protein
VASVIFIEGRYRSIMKSAASAARARREIALLMPAKRAALLARVGLTRLAMATLPNVTARSINLRNFGASVWADLWAGIKLKNKPQCNQLFKC